MNYVGEVAALVAAILWAGSSIFFTEASRRIDPVTINFTRMVFGLIYLALTLLIIGADFSISQSQLILLALSGFIGLVFGDTFLFKAFQMVGPRISMLLLALAPPFAALLAFIFLDEKLSFWGIAGIAVTLAGISLVILQRNQEMAKKFSLTKLGIFYGVLSAIGQGIGLILAKAAFNEAPVNGFLAAFIRLLASVVVFYPMLAFTSRFKNPMKKLVSDRKSFLITVIGSVFGLYLGITLSLVAISETYVGIASTLMGTTPVFVLPVMYFYYKEKLSFISIVGAFVAVGGIAILFLK